MSLVGCGEGVYVGLQLGAIFEADLLSGGVVRRFRVESEAAHGVVQKGLPALESDLPVLHAVVQFDYALLRGRKFRMRHKNQSEDGVPEGVGARVNTARPRTLEVQDARQHEVAEAAPLRKDHLVSLRRFQALMGWTSPQTVPRALAAHRIFAMDLEGLPYFPAFFADATYTRRHLAAVTKQLGDLPGGAKLQFFGSRKGSLSGQTPLEALAAGRLEIVLRLAAAHAES